MRKGMFRKLAVQNIRNNRSTYVPYMLTCIFCIAMMYMMELSHIGESSAPGSRSEDDRRNR